MSKLTMSIMIVSYARDFPWLSFLFRSIGRHCEGFNEIVLVIPEQDLPQLGPNQEALGLRKPKGKNVPEVKVMTFEETMSDPHIDALLCRCSADLCCESDLVLHCDSDCVFVEETTPEHYIHPNNWAINLYSPFKVVDHKPWPSHWGPCTERALGEPVPNETMRHHPFIGWRDTHFNFRKHIEKVHGKSLGEYLHPLKKGQFSEFCALGAFAMKHEPGYYWIDADSAERPLEKLWQFWSWHTVSHHTVQAKLRELGLLDLI